MTVRRSVFLFSACLLIAGGCADQKPIEPAAPPFIEAVAETIVFTEAEAIYYGDEGNTGVSDMWNIRMYTDGGLIQICCNTCPEPQMTSDCLEGVYTAPSGTGDYSVGTYNPGYMISIDVNGDSIEAPVMSYFGTFDEGSSDFVPDLLREGFTVVDINDDGTFTIEGTLIGQMFLKRNFTYTGDLTIINNSPARSMKKVLRRL